MIEKKSRMKPGNEVPKNIMKIGIVGHEAAKFTKRGEKLARAAIRRLLIETRATEVISGACHLGGIDIWAIEIGREMGLKTTEFPPKNQYWETGYKPRNIQIAQASDMVVCIVVDGNPEEFRGMRFPCCYHCGGTTNHVKSGGCWTAKRAQSMKRVAQWIIIENFRRNRETS